MPGLDLERRSPHHSSTCVCGQNTHTLLHIYWAHRTTPSEGEWQRFIWRAKAALPLCVSECVCACILLLLLSYQVPESLFARCGPVQTSLYALCVSTRAVFTCMCALGKNVYACLRGPPSWVLIGLAPPSWVSDPGQAPSRLAVGRASQPV